MRSHPNSIPEAFANPTGKNQHSNANVSGVRSQTAANIMMSRGFGKNSPAGSRASARKEHLNTARYVQKIAPKGGTIKTINGGKRLAGGFGSPSRGLL